MREEDEPGMEDNLMGGCVEFLWTADVGQSHGECDSHSQVQEIDAVNGVVGRSWDKHNNLSFSSRKTGTNPNRAEFTLHH